MQPPVLLGAVSRIVLAGLLLAQPAFADETSSLADADLNDLETISVFATKSPITPFEYPGQVTVVDRDVILDFNASSLSDIFQAVPGAVFSSGPRRTGDAPTIRGLGANGALVFLDGARQSFISGHDGRFFVDPELVQAVEVVRGPASALYGSGALGGVIATRTITARDMLEGGESLRVRLNTGFQSVNNELRVGATAAWQSDDGLVDVVGHMTFRDSGSIDLGNDTTLPADDQIVSSLLKATIRPTNDLELYGSWMRYGGDSTDPQNPQGNNIAGPGNDLVFRDIRSNTFQGGAAWAPEGNDLIDLQLVGYYTSNTVEEDEVESPRTVDREVQTIGIIVDNRSTFTLSSSATITFTYGGEYYQDEQRGIDTETLDGTRGGVPDATTDFYGAFIQADFSVTDLGPIPGKLNIIPGVRWDGFKSSAEGEAFNIDEDAVSPKIGVSYKPVPQFLIFGNYAEGFRAPSFNEAFADGTHFSIPNLTGPIGAFGPSFVGNLFIGNQNLRPETSQTWEIGAGVDFAGIFSADDTFTFKASYYSSDVDDLIGLDVNTPLGCFVAMFAAIQPCGTGLDFGNTSQNINIANANITGVEAEFSYDSEYVYARGNFASINGRDVETDAFLEGTLQPDIFFVDAGVKYADWGLRTGIRFTHAGKFSAVNTAAEARGSYTRGDLYAVWTPPVKELDGVRFDIGVDNVSDAAYEVVNAGVFEAGRNFKIAMTYSKGF